MRIRKRTLLLSCLLAGLVLALAAGWFYRSTRQALERAESFAFRRMTVAQQEEPGTYRFFFASNREPVEEAGGPEERLGNTRGEALRFGRFDTRIEPSLGLGMIINPTDWFQNEQLQVEAVEELEERDFVEEVRAQVEASPHRALLLLVHGYRNSFPTSLRMTALVAHVLDVNAPVMVLDWPGDQGSGIRGYRRAQEIASASGDDLARTLTLIEREIRPGKIWLLANSMGAQVVAKGFSRLYTNDAWADAETEIEDVVFTAPDIAKDEFGGRFRDEISALSRDITVYLSSNDRALLASRLLNRGRRLGESRLDPVNPDQWEEAVALAELLETGMEGLTFVDVTPVNRTRNFHNFSLETPEFFDDLFLRLTNEETPRSRSAYPLLSRDGTLFWVLTGPR